MKKTILVMLMVLMVSTPCLTEVELDSLFSLHGTKWKATIIFPETTLVYIDHLGFYEGKIYRTNESGDYCSITFPPELSFYLDLPGVSLCLLIEGGGGGSGIFSGIMSPLGFGVGFLYSKGTFKPAKYFFLHLTKVNDNWILSPECIESEARYMCWLSDGNVETRSCCKSVGDFPNLCLVGACTCTPENSHEVLVCQCPEGYCWNGVDDGCLAE